MAPGVHRRPEALDHRIALAGRDHALRLELVGVELAGARVLADLFVHQRLRERRRVLLVVPQLAKAHDVDDHVLAELRAEVHRQRRREHHRLGIVAVHVEDRRLDHLDDVGAVDRRARVARVGRGEADLVVDDDVHRAARAIAAGLREVQRLHHDALAGEGCVAVHHDRQHLRAVLVPAAVLARAGGPGHDRVHDLEVRRVERQRQVNRPAGRRDVAGEALVVLDVARRQIVGVLSLELGEQVLGHLAERVHQHVQPAAVGHPDHELLDALLAAVLDDLVHRRDEALAALEGEALLADVARVEVLLEALGSGQPVEDAALLVLRELGPRAGRLEPLLDPALLRRIVDVHELGADRAAVGLAQRADDVAQRRALEAEEGVGRRVDVGVVAFGEVVESGLELGDRRALLALERIEVGPARAEEAVRSDQLLDVDLLARGGRIAAHHPGLQRALAGPLCEGLDDRGVGHVAGLGVAVGGRHHLHGVEVGPPLLRNRAGIVQVAFVQLFDVRCVTAEQIGIGLKGLHHRASPLSTSFSSKVRERAAPVAGSLPIRAPAPTGLRTRLSGAHGLGPDADRTGADGSTRPPSRRVEMRHQTPADRGLGALLDAQVAARRSDKF